MELVLLSNSVKGVRGVSVRLRAGRCGTIIWYMRGEKSSVLSIEGNLLLMSTAFTPLCHVSY